MGVFSHVIKPEVRKQQRAVAAFRPTARKYHHLGEKRARDDRLWISASSVPPRGGQPGRGGRRWYRLALNFNYLNALPTRPCTALVPRGRPPSCVRKLSALRRCLQCSRGRSNPALIPSFISFEFATRKFRQNSRGTGREGDEKERKDGNLRKKKKRHSRTREGDICFFVRSFVFLGFFFFFLIRKLKNIKLHGRKPFGNFILSRCYTVVAVIIIVIIIITTPNTYGFLKFSTWRATWSRSRVHRPALINWDGETIIRTELKITTRYVFCFSSR